MTTRHLVDPELVTILDTFPALTLTSETLPLLRTTLKEAMARHHASAGTLDFSAISGSSRFISGPEDAPDVRVLLYLPTTAQTPLPALLWMHGSGYVLGSAAQDNLAAKSIASTVVGAVASVDYRLAPETPHPGPVEDCYAVLRWLHSHAEELCVDPTRIAKCGRGTLRWISAAHTCLISPMLDDRTGTATESHPYTGEFIWTPEATRFGWTALLGQEPGGPDVSPYAAAARAEHLEGLPPTLSAWALLTSS